jgi:putative (di)nucleoside polyphosphate hydrolase
MNSTMMSKKLPLRIGVGIILLNHENKVFVGKRIDNQKGDRWQMPQGGIDENENYLQAARRELREETSIQSVKVIKELNEWLTYELPKNLLGKIWKGKYRGQKQKWFIMKFLGKNDEINIKTLNPEFLEWKWIKPTDLPLVAVAFKINIYKKLKQELIELNIN